ncbi:MAG: 2-oxoacid:ferredoxin oxidoreductase subunit beta [Candidatus Bathyarchaeota archaeon]|nr:MAG: 2-oxoacid:ferredoxin oxidoreductase subunit beta [Candidatus Bathyarchaeota archaeon]
MTTMQELATPVTNTWCPGCGDFGILMAFKRAIMELGLEPEKVVAVSGIGCHGKITNYVNVNGLHVIHGRVLPAASAVKLANSELTVVGFAGDGDAYNIGMGHLPHAARRNHDINLVVHNNMIYGLTTGQASPTSMRGHRTRTTPRGVFERPVDPLSLALASGASFVARGYAGDVRHLTGLLVEAMAFSGFALVDVLQPCVSWNRDQTYEFYGERIYKLEDEGYDPTDAASAREKALAWGERIPIGVFYRKEREAYLESFPFLEGEALVRKALGDIDISELLKEFS